MCVSMGTVRIIGSFERKKKIVCFIFAPYLNSFRKKVSKIDTKDTRDHERRLLIEERGKNKGL